MPCGSSDSTLKVKCFACKKLLQHFSAIKMNVCWFLAFIHLTFHYNFWYLINCISLSSSELLSGRPPTYSYSDSWTTEELWPKEKSIVHVKLLRPSPKEVLSWRIGNKDVYLNDPSLDFDSPSMSQTLNNCLIEYKAVDSDGLLQVQISGEKCIHLPLSSLHPINNLTHLVIRDTGLVNLTKFIFGAAKLEKLKRIDIIGNKQLSCISGRAFDGLLQLSYLSIIHNTNISHVSLEAFVGLKNLEELIWVANNDIDSKIFITLTRASSIRILPSLIHLHLSGLSDPNHDDTTSGTIGGSDSPNSLNSGLKINKDDFAFLSHLKYLQITNCDIRYIHMAAFVPLRSKLIALNLSGNNRVNLQSLKQSLMNGFQINSSPNSLEKLDLSSTLTIKSLPKDLLSTISKTKVSELYLNKMNINQILIGDIPPMPNLEKLHIEYSQLEVIEESSFQELEELKELSLRGNFLRTVPPNFISDLPKLEYLDISGYQTERTNFDIPPKIFIGTELKEVNLSYKILETLPRNAFLGLFKMQRFHLRGCGLKWVEYLTFFPLKSAIYIDLSENNDLISTLKDTHEDSFFGLEAIQMVRMSHNNLTSKDISDNDSIFKRMHEHVQLLDLSYNNIDRLNATTFSDFVELQHLDLSHNSIKSWTDFSIFSKNEFITTLDISHNNISHLTSSMLEDFHRLKNLSFAMNPLRCDCRSQVVMDWLNDTNNVRYLRNSHPLFSKTQYFCIFNNNEKMSFKAFVDFCAKNERESTRVSLTLLSAISSVLLLLALIVVVLAFIYHSTLHSLLNGVVDDLQLNYQYDAFVSYNVNDSEWVFKHLVPNIENNDSDHQRIKLCVYDRDFIAGRPISECILESIKTSRKVILVISNNFIKSPWCIFETDLAHNTLVDQNREGLIMIKLEEIDSLKVAPQLHFLLKTRIYLQWTETNPKEQDIFWKKLRRALGFNYPSRRNYYSKYYNKVRRSSMVLAPGRDKSKTKEKTDKCMISEKRSQKSCKEKQHAITAEPEPTSRFK